MAKGGRRPGSGRKKKATVEEQQTRRDVLLKVVSPERWEKIVEKIVKQAEAGNFLAILPYLPYLLGSPRVDINVTGTVEHVRISEIRQALGVPNVIDLPLPRKAAGA